MLAITSNQPRALNPWVNPRLMAPVLCPGAASLGTAYCRDDNEWSYRSLAAAVIQRAVMDAAKNNPLGLRAREWLKSEGSLWYEALGRDPDALIAWVEDGCKIGDRRTLRSDLTGGENEPEPFENNHSRK